jgi:hypothetical protein
MDSATFLEILSERGAAHEQNYMEHLTKSGLEVADQPGPEIFAHASNLADDLEEARSIRGTYQHTQRKARSDCGRTDYGRRAAGQGELSGGVRRQVTRYLPGDCKDQLSGEIAMTTAPITARAQFSIQRTYAGSINEAWALWTTKSGIESW